MRICTVLVDGTGRKLSRSHRAAPHPDAGL